MRIEIEFNKYKKTGDVYEEEGDGVCLIEYQVEDAKDESKNNWVFQIDGTYYYFNAQDVSDAIEALIKREGK